MGGGLLIGNVEVMMKQKVIPRRAVKIAERGRKLMIFCLRLGLSPYLVLLSAARPVGFLSTAPKKIKELIIEEPEKPESLGEETNQTGLGKE